MSSTTSDHGQQTFEASILGNNIANILLSRNKMAPDVHIDPVEGKTLTHNQIAQFARKINCGKHKEKISVHVFPATVGWHCTITPANGNDIDILKYLQDQKLIISN